MLNTRFSVEGIDACMSKIVHIKLILILVCISLFCLSLSVNAEKFNMSYLYGNFNYSNLVNRTFISDMHDKGVKVVPFLSNHWDRELGRLALYNAESLSSQIADAVKKYDLDGVNVDIENVTAVDRDDYTKLVRLLREKLPEDKSVSVAVAANPYGWTSGWHASYDYAELAKYADYLMIMAYDEHYESGEVGPVASIDFVEKSIQYALTKIDKSKVVIGIPFYGRYWKNGASYGGYGVSLTKIDEIVNSYESQVEFDEKTQSVKATVTIKAADKKPVINGRTLYEGEYTFWYENEDSIKAKLALVNKYDIKGSGSWSLGQELGSTWDYYKEVLDGISDVYVEGFVDVLEDFWAKDAIRYVKQNGYMKGKTTSYFGAKDYLTRAEMAMIIVRILGKTDEQVNTVSYSVTYGHWAQNEIEVVRKLGIMQGGTSDKFRPNDYITREEAAKVFALLDVKNNQNLEEVSFTDVSEARWSYSYIVDIAKKGLINGYEDNTFLPTKNINRAEVATILQRAFE